MPIDTSDLIPFQASELVIDGYFYVKEDDGYHRAVITQWELNTWKRHGTIEKHRQNLEKLSKEGRLFRRASVPWGHF